MHTVSTDWTTSVEPDPHAPEKSDRCILRVARIVGTPGNGKVLRPPLDGMCGTAKSLRAMLVRRQYVLPTMRPAVSALDATVRGIAVLAFEHGHSLQGAANIVQTQRRRKGLEVLRVFPPDMAARCKDEFTRLTEQ